MPFAQVDASRAGGPFDKLRTSGDPVRIPVKLRDPGELADSSHSQGDETHLLVLLGVGIQLLVSAMEIGRQMSQELHVGQVRVGDRNGDLVDLVQVTHVGRVLDLHRFRGHALGQQLVPALGSQFREDAPELAEVHPVQAHRVRPEVVVPDISVQHAVGRQHWRRGRDVHPFNLQLAGNLGGVQTGGPAESHNGELARVDPS